MSIPRTVIIKMVDSADLKNCDISIEFDPALKDLDEKCEGAVYLATRVLEVLQEVVK